MLLGFLFTLDLVYFDFSFVVVLCLGVLVSYLCCFVCFSFRLHIEFCFTLVSWVLYCVLELFVSFGLIGVDLGLAIVICVRLHCGLLL